MVNLSITLDEFLELVQQLTPDEKAMLRQHLAEQAADETTLASWEPRKERIFGLHQGTIWTSDDFDDPLPNASP